MMENRRRRREKKKLNYDDDEWLWQIEILISTMTCDLCFEACKQIWTGKHRSYIKIEIRHKKRIKFASAHS